MCPYTTAANYSIRHWPQFQIFGHRLGYWQNISSLPIGIVRNMDFWYCIIVYPTDTHGS